MGLVFFWEGRGVEFGCLTVWKVNGGREEGQKKTKCNKG